MKLKQRIVEWWDWKIYWLAYKTFNRMCRRNEGFAYLFHLHVEEWLRRHPLSPELKHSTEQFYKSLANTDPRTR